MNASAAIHRNYTRSSDLKPVAHPLADALEKMAMLSPLNADLLALAKRVRG